MDMGNLIRELISAFRGSAAKSTALIPPPQDGLSKEDRLFVENQDILEGFRFEVNYSLDTPLAVLNHHGDVFSGPPGKSPLKAIPPHAFWTPVVEGLEDLAGEASSEFGPLHPRDQKTVLEFLKEFRAIVETELPADEKLVRLKALTGQSPKYAALAGTWVHGQFPDDWFIRTMTAVPGVGRGTARLLFQHGFKDVDDLSRATDQELLAVPGVGSGVLRKIRSFLATRSSRQGRDHP